MLRRTIKIRVTGEELDAARGKIAHYRDLVVAKFAKEGFAVVDHKTLRYYNYVKGRGPTMRTWFIVEGDLGEALLKL